MEMSRPDPSGVRAPRPWGRRERLLIALNVAAMILLAIGVVIAVNVAGDRLLKSHPSWRHDWSEERLNTLSPETLATLSSLERPVRVVHFYRPLTRAEAFIALRTQQLLEHYALESDRIALEIVDPDRDPARADQVIAELSLAPGGGAAASNVTVFLCGSNRKDVPQRDVARLTPGNPRAKPPEEPQIATYNAEEPFTQALRSVTDERQAVIYWLEGHGETDMQDNTSQTGVSEIVRAMGRDNFKLDRLNLGSRDVPADADVILAHGPRRSPSREESAKLEDYLERGGKLFLVADAFVDLAGWSPVLEPYGIALSNSDMVTFEQPSRCANLDPEVPVVTEGYSPTHPITRELYDLKIATVWPRTRPLVVKHDRREAHVEPIVFTSTMGWGERYRETDRPGERRPNGRFDSDDEVRGPIGLVVASEEIRASGAKTRVVVAGDADFSRNSWLTAGANRELFENALGWLADRSRAIGIRPRQGSQRLVILTKPLLSSLFYGAGLALPGFVLLLGCVVLLYRRK